MSPDIEWRVGEDADQETIVRTSSPPPSRRGRWAVLIAIGLGVGLGLLYRSTREPPPNPISPTSTPAVFQAPLSPLPAPESLDAAIQRDVYALAANAPEFYNSLFVTTDAATREYAVWYRALQSSNVHWNTINPLNAYTVFETGTLSSGIAWAKMGQFRNNDFFRQTRFYRLRNNQWVWTLPDQSFWSGVVHTHTFAYPWSYPFTIVYPVEDEALVPTVGDRFARALAFLCSSLNCPPNQSKAPPWSQSITLTIVIDPSALNLQTARAQAQNLMITMPSLRVVGFYENPNRPGDPLNAIVYGSLIDPITQLASGDYQRWSNDRGGEAFLQAIADWQRVHIKEIVQPFDLFFKTATSLPGVDSITTTPRAFYAAALRAGSLASSSSLGSWSSEDTRFGLFQGVAQTEAEAVVAFINERYGAEGVIRFLNALGTSTSLEEALAVGLDVKFGEFNRQWAKWIAGD